MRFGKRPRTGRFFGRKTAEPPTESATPESATYEPVGNDEWNALVTPGADQAAWHGNGRDEPGTPTMDQAGDEQSMSAEIGRETTLDPTNRLLTALGRFHREVLKAREGSAHAQWPDVCMNQLIGAVEIALGQDWGEVVEALGETGRVLQSYDEAGRANDSVAFLEDAYEVLCLMVGDLIVGTVRPGVVQKWKDRYARAIEDLEAEGLALVDDDDGAVSVHAEPADPFGDAEPSPAAAAEAPFDSLPALDALAPLEDEVASADDDDNDIENSADVTGMLDTVSEALGLIEANAGRPNPAAFATISDAIESLREAAHAEVRHGAVLACDVMLRLCDGAQQVSDSLDESFFELAYGFPGLYAEAGDDDSVDSWSMECETQLLRWSAMTEEVQEPEPATEATPFDLADLDEAPAPAPPSDIPDLSADIEAVEPIVAADAVDSFAMPVDASAVEEAAPLDEFAEYDPPSPPAEDEAAAIQQALGDLIDAGAESAIEAVTEDIAPLDEFIDTPMQILKVAEQAVSEGRATNAKLLLLQAAASIAEAEAAEARDALDQATRRIQEEAEAIEAAMTAVTEAEAQVAEAESAVTQGAADIEARRAQVSEHQERVSDVQARIDEIDEEIRVLQARREEEVAHLEQSRDELTAAEADAAQFEADISRRQEQEAETRQRLEEARAQVKHHQRRRQEFENALDKANDEVRQRSESLSDLQQTMNRFGLPAGPEEYPSGDLFSDGSSE